MPGTESLLADCTDDFELLDLSTFCAMEEMVGVDQGIARSRDLAAFHLLTEIESKTQTLVAAEQRPEGFKMKKLLSLPLGEKGKVALTIESGKIRLAASYIDKADVSLSAGYPVAELVQPLKEKFIDKLKAKIPGNIDDAILDKAWAEALEYIEEEK